MPTKKKHHYIPQFYIANFTNSDGNVFVLEHETGKINEQTKNGTFHRRKFYTMDLAKHEPRSPESTERMRKMLGLENVDTSSVKEHPDMVEDLLAECESIAAPGMNDASEIYDAHNSWMRSLIARFKFRFDSGKSEILLNAHLGSDSSFSYLKCWLALMTASMSSTFH